MKEIIHLKEIRYLSAVVLGILAIFLATQSILTWKQMRFVGSGVDATNTIQVNGFGKVNIKPDVATFSVTVGEEDIDQAVAERKATQKINQIITYIKGEGVAKKDISTTSYSLNPQYDWKNSQRTLRGYRVSQTVTVHVRELKKAGTLLSYMSRFKAERISGLTLTLDDAKGVKARARAIAITDAQGKARVLAGQLGVTLVRIVGFAENQPQQKYPVLFARSLEVRANTPGTSPTPEIPTGEKEFSSNVTITYEIR